MPILQPGGPSFDVGCSPQRKCTVRPRSVLYSHIVGYSLPGCTAEASPALVNCSINATAGVARTGLEHAIQPRG